MPPAPRPLWDRFWAQVAISDDLDACWPWTGALSRKRAGADRGVIQEGGRGSRILLAHVVALALFTDGEFVKYNPETGERLQVCHRCGNRLCCNGRHLYWGTAADNCRDRYGAGNSGAGWKNRRSTAPRDGGAASGGAASGGS